MNLLRTEQAAMWRAGLWMGLRSLPEEPLLGMKRCVLPVSYWRAAEFAYVWRRLNQDSGGRILDVGSPKDLASLLAAKRGFEIIATDILNETVDLSRRYVRALGLDGRGPGKVLSEVADGRELAYEDQSFDAAYAVSVIEHIPDHGDTAAVKELVRVVRPGGIVVLTVPFAAEYDETYVNRPVYERTQVDGEPIFFERHYDWQTLTSRLIKPVGADLVDVQLWGEPWFPIERLLGRWRTLRLVLSPLEPALSMLFLKQIDPNDQTRAKAAFLTLARK